jgi:hypothetical protein
MRHSTSQPTCSTAILSNSAYLTTVQDWTTVISEQPGIRHWNFVSEFVPLLGANELPLLTSARIYTSQLLILAHRPIRTLRLYDDDQPLLGDLCVRLKPFGDTLRSLSLIHMRGTIWSGCALRLVRMLSDVVPRLEFLDLDSDIFVSFFPRPSEVSLKQ